MNHKIYSNGERALSRQKKKKDTRYFRKIPLAEVEKL